MTAAHLTQLRDLVLEVASWNPLKLGTNDETFNYVDLSAVDQELKAITGARTISCSDAPSRARQIVRVGDVLVSTVRPNLNGVAMVPANLDGATASTGFCVIRPNPGLLDSSYVFHWVKSPSFVSSMVNQATGASYPAVSDRIVLDSRIPLPPLPEQRRIAAILDKADALCAKRREALAQLDRLAQSIFVEMFGDPVASGIDEVHVPFEQVTERITYGFTSPMKHLESGIPILTAKNVKNGFLDLKNVHYADKTEFDALTSKSKPKRGDILITKDGTIGRTAVVATDDVICINQSVALIQLDHSKVMPEYVAGYLCTDAVQGIMKNMSKGNSLAHLQITELAKLPFPLPSIEMQAEFNVRVAQLAKLQNSQQGAAEEANSLFASLQHRAFRGEL